MKIYYSKSILSLALLSLLGCSPGSGNGLDVNGRPLDSSTPPESSNNNAPVQATYADIQSKVFTLSCAVSGCHTGPAAPLGLKLEANSAFELLVNQPSQQESNFMRINPGDPANSYLVQKLEGTATSGLQMPRNQAPLPLETIQAIRDWIQDGALGPKLSSIQANIFTPICVQCHVGDNPAGSLNLEEGNSFANLVGIKRRFDEEIRVVANDADNSFIIHKLENNNLGGSRGDQMPLGGPALKQSTIDVIRQWIDAGAENN
jgi:hypothetical protein